MAETDSTYYSLTRVRDASPEAADWAVTDGNWDVVSKILKNLEQHTHTGVATLGYPGYDVGDPNNPDLSTLTESVGSGILGPGVILGVRLAYENAAGLETEASPEVSFELSPAVSRPLTPELVAGWPVSKTVASTGDLAGGTYVYGITKGRGSGETELSDLLPVDVPYDDTYQVKITFDDIQTYTTHSAVGNTYASSAEITNIDTTDIYVGMLVSGAGVPANTYVLTVLAEESKITITNNATATAVGTALYFDDGTDTLNIYRAEGLDGEFTLIDKITDDTTTEYIDEGGQDPALVGISPPSASTFDSTKSVNIDWSGLTIPTDATKLLVYVTQEPFLWGNKHLLAEVTITTGTPAYTDLDYTGAEDLLAGKPKDSSQIISAPPKINLATEATGAPILTADMDFANYKASNIKLDNAPITKEAGMIWYDTSGGGQLILRGASSDLVLAQAGAGYTHPYLEGGGHNSSNIFMRSTNAASTTINGDQAMSTSTPFSLLVASTTGFDSTGHLVVQDTTGQARHVVYFSKDSTHFLTCLASANVTADGGTTVYQGIRDYDVLSQFRDPVTLSNKQVQVVASSIGTTDSPSTSSSSFSNIAEMSANVAGPTFNGQWLKVTWDIQLVAYTDPFGYFDVTIQPRMYDGFNYVDNAAYERTHRFYYQGESAVLSGEVWYNGATILNSMTAYLRWKLTAISGGETVICSGTKRRISAQWVL